MKHRTIYTLIGTIVFIFALTNSVPAQFYNGLHMSFGKNRIQYERSDVLESDFYSSFYRFDRFDVYFYPNGQELAEYVSKKAVSELTRLENFFEYSLNKRVIFLVYNRLTDFRQSNIGLISGREETNIGGVTRILDNKVFLYFEGDYARFDQQIIAAISEVILQEMLYGGSVRDRVTSSALLNLPEWYYKGLLSYLSKGWDIETDDRVRDGILNNRFAKFNRLSGDDAVNAGHAIWNFIAETFGQSVIPPIVYFTRVNRNVSSGFTNVLGLSLNALTVEWLHFYKSRYDQDAYSGEVPQDPSIKIKNRKELKYLRARISPDGRFIAYVTNQSGRIKVHLYDDQKAKSRVIYRTGAKLGQLEDYSFPVLSWHPSGELLAMSSEFKGDIRFSIYPIETGKWEHDEWELFDKILDFSYSSDGLNVVVSGVVKGQTDLFIHNLLAHTNVRLTNDRADDFSPKFIDNDRSILFTSNRIHDKLSQQKEDDRLRPSHDIFSYTYAGGADDLIRLAPGNGSSRYQPHQLSNKSFIYLGEDNGIRNRYAATYDSTIVASDTTINYSFCTRSSAISNYKTGVADHSLVTSTGEYVELLKYNNK